MAAAAEIRAALTEQEVEKSSVFKIYTKNNCKYECYVELIGEMCKCIPWEFIHNTSALECDIFGRACFFKAMEYTTTPLADQCQHCMADCDFINFDKVITVQNDLADSAGYNPYIYNFVGKYLKLDKLTGVYLLASYLLLTID